MNLFQYSFLFQIQEVLLVGRKEVPRELLLSLLHKVDLKLSHPLKESIFDAAREMIDDKKLSVEDTIYRMRPIKEYRREYCALNIIYFSCDDTEGKVESIYQEITSSWLI